MLKATLIGGALFGFVGGLPVLGLLNCACCALFVAGGFVASYLYSKECKIQGAGFRAGNGAMVGLVAGLFYAIVNTIVGGIAKAFMPQPDPEQMMEMLEQFNLPPESVEIAEKWMASSVGLWGLIIGFFVTLLLAAVFSTLGGLIGGSVFKVEPAPPASAAGSSPPPPPIS
jgi:hypothetical protein